MLPIIFPIGFGLIFLAFEAGIKKTFFAKKIPLKELEEDDIIATEFLTEETQKLLDRKFKKVLGKNEKKILEENNVKELWVFRDLPKFGPFIFAGTVVALLYPDVLLGMFMV